MKISSQITRLAVSLEIEGDNREVGELVWSKAERRSYFQYAGAFIDAPLLISPFHLPVRTNLQEAKQQPFEGLHGLFNDSLPDGWGRLLLDKKLQKLGIDYTRLTPLDRLAAVGQTGMGALTFFPVLEDKHDDGNTADLDWFAEEIENVVNELPTAEVEVLQSAQGGSAGARPKIVVGCSEDQSTIVIDHGYGLPEDFEPWLVKFRSREDPLEIGVEEQAYALMAQAAGIDMPETRVICSREGNSFFATKRFDRSPLGRLHMHTASGLLYADHRLPSLDYNQILKLTAMMTRDHRDVRQMFKRMVFNVLARNRDDHAKNHAFLMDKTGSWRLSPAYDLTFSHGPAGEHCTTVAGEGLSPSCPQMLEVARQASISKSDALEEIELVRSTVGNWTMYAEQAGLSAERSREINRQIND